MSKDTSSTMVSEPSGLLTCLERFSALRTLSRIIGAWALGISLVFIALQDAVAADRTILVFGDSLSAARTPAGTGLGCAARAKASDTRLRVPGRQRQCQRRDHQRRPAAPAARARAAPAGSRDPGARRQRRTARAAGGRAARQPRADGAAVTGGRAPACSWWAFVCRPTTGQRYGEHFADVYPDLAQQFSVPLVPFLLQDVALDPALMQEDGMHPNAAGEPAVLDNVWPHLKSASQQESLERER